ncbi:DUF3281 family protein [Francisella tularensis subsp. novicida]|uniref:DUF3281 family protein n=1 Tax=Francisella tularensis TaxID=263 RepID=UPI000158B0E8|nr:DUF3281 family protein [Francisella tularensis]AJI45233.1 hypothetical protein AS84_1419 [Francisella tularensis subsp. novicida F6168]AJI73531.1 hypothetical protein AQ14_1573 [Francisella tularensis subsp. novicida D9876]AJJ46521.1 hypothetical protein CH70_839 [Francisella tularensis subsp. novicida]APC98848.1 hypothetical protein KX03_1137 [Francisella tularensis subsp. novicida]EDN36438.1 conserved hypothetical protein [Francisella tularensis subsp. novicida GA99-3549]
MSSARIAKKNFLIEAVVISSTALLANCGKSETARELRIVDDCNTVKNLCKFELTDAEVSHYTNILGKNIERVESQTPLHDSDIKGTITWNTPAGATLADNATVQTKFGSGCQDDNCTANANPTAYNLPAGENKISVSGIVTINGKSVDLAKDVKPDIIYTEAVVSHVFPTGALPDGLTLQALVDALNHPSNVDLPFSANGVFSSVGSQLAITCNSGYMWLDDQDPAYGEFTFADKFRGAAYVQWSGDSRTFTQQLIRSLSRITRNGQTEGNDMSWEAGCWPVDSSK